MNNDYEKHISITIKSGQKGQEERGTETAGQKDSLMEDVREEARRMASAVLGHLKEVRGPAYGSLTGILRDPGDTDNWAALEKAVRALCGKRYAACRSRGFMDMVMTVITCHVACAFMEEAERAGTALTRDAVMYCCMSDAIFGIAPWDGFSCLTDEDYERLNFVAGLADVIENGGN